MLLRVDILAGDVEILIVVEADAHRLGHLVSCLTTTEHRTGAFADADGIAHTEGVLSEHLTTLHQQLIVGNQTRTDIDNVDAVYHLLRAGNGLEVLTLRNHRSRHSRMVGIGDGTHQGVARHNGNAQSSDAVGLHRKTALAGHRLNDGLDGSSGLHALIGSQIADVACAHRQHTLTQQCVLLVHHLLEHSGGINAWHVVVFKRRHEGNGSRCHHQILSIHVSHLARDDVLDGHAPTFQQVPHRIVQQDAFVVLAGQCLGDIEATHATELLLLLEEEELMRLHIELTTYLAIVVNHDVVDAKGIQLLAAGKTGRTGTDDGHLRLVDLHLTRLLRANLGHCHLAIAHQAHLLHAVYLGDADATHLAINQHLTRSALADAAVQAAVATVEAVTVNGIACLVQGGGNRIALPTQHLVSFIHKFHHLALRDV